MGFVRKNIRTASLSSLVGSCHFSATSLPIHTPHHGSALVCASSALHAANVMLRAAAVLAAAAGFAVATASECVPFNITANPNEGATLLLGDAIVTAIVPPSSNGKVACCRRGAEFDHANPTPP